MTGGSLGRRLLQRFPYRRFEIDLLKNTIKQIGHCRRNAEKNIVKVIVLYGFDKQTVKRSEQNFSGIVLLSILLKMCH